MAKISLEPLADIEGFRAAALVDSDSGLMMMGEGGDGDLELAAAGHSEVLKAKRRINKALNLNDRIEDILISMGKHYHLIRPLERNDKLFLYLILDRAHANLALARHRLRAFEKDLDFS